MTTVASSLTTPPPRVLRPYTKYMDRTIELYNPLGDLYPLYSFKFRNCTLDLQHAGKNLWTIIVKSPSLETCKQVLSDYPNGVMLTRPGFKDKLLRTYRYGADDQYIKEMLSRLTSNHK